MSDEAREAAMTQSLEALNWKSLTTEEMVAFILGAVVSAARSGIRQARAEAWDEGSAYAYWQERGYDDFECRTRGVPSHLVDEFAEWNPYRNPRG